MRRRRIAGLGAPGAREEGNCAMKSREFRSIFWDDLVADLGDLAFCDSYAQATTEIAVIDRAENERRESEAKSTSTSY